MMLDPLTTPPLCVLCGAVAKLLVNEEPHCQSCAQPAVAEADKMRDDLFARACAIPSDINQHLPLLRWLAARCKHITEMGTRFGISTIAFLAAQPDDLVSWDLDPAAILGQPILNLTRLSGRTRFQPRVGDTLKVRTEPTDLLFIDTWHTGRQLLSELERHADPQQESVRKYLVFHDTATFGLVGEDGKAPGLRTAVRQFQRYHAFPLWKLMALPEAVGDLPAGTLLDLDRNNGLVVLEHVCADGHSPERLREHCAWCGKAVP